MPEIFSGYELPNAAVAGGPFGNYVFEAGTSPDSPFRRTVSVSQEGMEFLSRNPGMIGALDTYFRVRRTGRADPEILPGRNIRY